ncbi:MAG: hypothetical protein WD512_03925 [Candidatus Paceibacterota bacterium]
MDQNTIIIILGIIIFLILFNQSPIPIESFDGCGRRRGPGTSYDERERIGDQSDSSDNNQFKGTSNVYSENPARGYYTGEIKKDNDFQAKQIDEKPCNSNFKVLGYDNPYIYPYNYCWNQNLPPTKFKYPGWFRQLWVDSDKNQFPGYMY